MTQSDLRYLLEQGLPSEIGRPILIEEAPYTYPIKEAVWDNWLPFAYRAFSRIAQGGRDIRSFASIGCGSGADAIGAHYAFPKLEMIILSDIDERVLPLAHRNVTRHAQNKKVIALEGSLCAPLQDRDLHVNLIYENLPNIPEIGDVSEGCRRSSRFQVKEAPAGDLIDRYLLRSHAEFLRQAHDVLLPGGIALCSIGGRVPYSIIEEMVTSSGYQYLELVRGFKMQTEPEEVLPGYAQAEKDGITFNFYRYDQAMKGRNGEPLFDALARERISAREALELYYQDNAYKVGHVVHMIAAIKK